MSLSAKARIFAPEAGSKGLDPQVGYLPSCFPGSIRRIGFVLLRINAKQAMVQPRHGRHHGDEPDAAKPS